MKLFPENPILRSLVIILGLGGILQLYLYTFLTVYNIPPDSGVVSPLLTSLLDTFLIAATIAMVVEIRNQVMKEKDYLENFEPDIKLVRVSNSKILGQELSEDGRPGFYLLAVNTSQTSAVIEEVYFEEYRGLGLHLRGGPSMDEDDKYDGSVPAEANESVYIQVEASENLDEYDLDGLLDGETGMETDKNFLTLVVTGDFGRKTKDIPIARPN